MDEVKIGQKLTDSQAMTLAMKQARKGLGSVSPNPPVGCVILDEKGCLLSLGFHEKFGGAHAEVNALNGLTSDQLEGARVFVTLEPCAHHGKTPPCAEALAKLPLAEVIFGLYDPNPLVKGKGAALIEAAGIKTSHYASDQESLEAVCEHFLKNMRSQQPFVSIKCASSVDGKLALKNGLSKWITGAEARIEGHFLRATHDAILVGVGTFLSDNPSLDVRHPNFTGKTNKVLVVDPKGIGINKLATSKILATHQPENVYWVVSPNANTESLAQHRLKIIKTPYLPGTEEIDLQKLKSEIWSLGFRSLLVEGGGETISSFINQKAADRMYLFVAPIIIGETSGVAWASKLNSISTLSQAVALSPFELSSAGKDSLLTARFL
ncbi:MAG: bifunctional diaminohydroxyphosphoribosylaminopyrimidine [Pseudomonadota bacterium]|jgi:diaminohydroxyphosphoribosylaminopyrimidine deaminase/5-amino-6-(5-phosphoribosylamino)uracil reductase